MFGIVTPPISQMYKCRDCGWEFKPLFEIIKPKKCPHCGGKNIKVSVGVFKPSSGPIVY